MIYIRLLRQNVLSRIKAFFSQVNMESSAFRDFYMYTLTIIYAYTRTNRVSNFVIVFN